MLTVILTFELLAMMQMYTAQVFYAISTTSQIVHLIFIAKGWGIGSFWCGLIFFWRVPSTS